MEMDDGIRRRVARLQQELSLSARKVPAANFHATLVFLGQQPASAFDAFIAAADGHEAPLDPITLDRVSKFRRSRVVWLGCSDLPASWSLFQQNLVTQLSSSGYRPERREWRLHITLYRDLRKPLTTLSVDALSWRCKSFSLMESISTPQGVRYRPISRWTSSDQTNNPQFCRQITPPETGG